MKLIIDAEGVKRELNAPFNLCAGAADLRALRDQLNLILADDRAFYYGWVSVYPRPDATPSGSPPQPWATAAPDLLAALSQCQDALQRLAIRAGYVPEFNEGGYAYEASENARAIIAKASMGG